MASDDTKSNDPCLPGAQLLRYIFLSFLKKKKKKKKESKQEQFQALVSTQFSELNPEDRKQGITLKSLVIHLGD